MLSKRSLPLAFLLLAICFVYANSFSNSFHFDDFHTITDNPAVRSLRNLPRIFTDTTAFSVLPANQTYRPIVTASLALDYALGGGYRPFPFHLSTLLWFLLLVSVLYRFTELLLDRVEASAANRWLALGVAAWFGLHPAMVETVDYIIQRGDVYCTLGCLAALYLFARSGPSRRYGIYLLPFVLAMLSKPPAAVFPLLLAAYVFFFEEAALPLARRWRRSVWAAAPALAATGFLLWLQSAMTPASFAPSVVSPAAYRLTQPYVWLRYCGALFLPLHLNVDTDLAPFTSLNARAAIGLLFALCLVLAIIVSARHHRLYPIAFGLLWFVLTQLPTSMYALSEVENDHRMFFSFPGLMLALTWSLYLLYGRVAAMKAYALQRSRLVTPVLSTLTALCLCGYAYGAHRRNAVWRSEGTLWADDVAKSPHNGRGLMIYGLTRMDAGDLRGALALYTRALTYTPAYPTLEINLGVVNSLLAAQEPAQSPTLQAAAEQHFRRALALAPTDDTTHAFYGRWLLAQGRIPEATRQLETAVRLNPGRMMQRELLLHAYEASGNIAAARELAQSTLLFLPNEQLAHAILDGSYRKSAANPATAALIEASLAAYRVSDFSKSIELAKQALQLDAHSAEAWNNVGAGYGALRQWDLGIAAEQRALALDPSLAVAGNNLRWFLAQRSASPSPDGKGEPKTEADYINLSLALNRSGQYAASTAAAQRALALNPASPEAWNNIAANNEAQHRWDDAIAAAQKAIALRPDFQLAKNNLAWSQQQKAATARH